MKKMKIVWLVNEKFTNNFSSFYYLCKEKKSLIDLTVLAVPHLGMTTSKEISDYLFENNILNIDSYDEKNDKYFDIKEIKPDYVFYTTPYNIYYPEEYRSDVVSKYSKVCCVIYGAGVIKTIGLYKDIGTNPFVTDSYNMFVESKYSMVCQDKSKYKIIGYLKLDNYTNIVPSRRIKVMWKPRWTLEKNDSNFFNYFDILYDYFLKHPDIDFSIYFHPLIMNKVIEKGYQNHFDECIKKLNSMKNYVKCSDSEFLLDVLGSNVFITDHSSTMAEFFTTGKPILYCETSAKLNGLGKKIVRCSYKIRNEKQLIKQLDRVLFGFDYKKLIRNKKKHNLFFVPTSNKKVAQNLYDYLIKDYNE